MGLRRARPLSSVSALPVPACVRSQPLKEFTGAASLRHRPTVDSAVQAANDGDPATYWCANDNLPGHWWKVDLGQPQSIAGAMMPFPERAGTASSLLGVSQMLCASLSGIIVGQLLGTSARPVAIPLAICGCLTLLLWAISRGVRAHEVKRARGEH